MSAEDCLSTLANAEDTITLLDNVSTVIENLQQITQKPDNKNETSKHEKHLLREYNRFQLTLKNKPPKRNSDSDIEEITQVHSSPILRRTSSTSITHKTLNNYDGTEEIGTENIKSKVLRRYASFQSSLRPSKQKRKSSSENLEEVGKNDKKDLKSSLLRRYASFQSTLKPNFTKKHSSSENLMEGSSQKERSPFLQRYGSFQSSLRPKFRKVSSGFRRLSCVTKDEEEDIPIEATYRHKSIDIGVGLARRMSLFLFTKRTVCVHPYHPYTPPQSTRKIYFGFDPNKT